MNAYNPLASMKRLKEAGFPSEIEDGRNQLVAEERLTAVLDKQTIKISIIMAAMLTLVCTIIGVITSLTAAH